MSCPYSEHSEQTLAYLRGQLPDDQAQSFERHFVGCDDCAQELIFLEKAAFLMSNYGKIVFPQPRPVNVKTGWLAVMRDRLEEMVAGQWVLQHGALLAGAAAVVAFIFLTAVLAPHFGPVQGILEGCTIPTGANNSSAVKAKITLPHLEWPAESLPASDSNLYKELSTIRELYNDKRNYREAAEQLAGRVDRFASHPELRLFYGVALLQSDNLDAAAVQLQRYQAERPTDPAATWVLAHAYLHTQHEQEAVALLKTIATNDNSPFQNSAKSILKTLK